MEKRNKCSFLRLKTYESSCDDRLPESAAGVAVLLPGRHLYIPITWIRSPGLQASMRSSSERMFTELGRWPAGDFSGISCIGRRRQKKNPWSLHAKPKLIAQHDPIRHTKKNLRPSRSVGMTFVKHKSFSTPNLHAESLVDTVEGQNEYCSRRPA